MKKTMLTALLLSLALLAGCAAPGAASPTPTPEPEPSPETTEPPEPEPSPEAPPSDDVEIAAPELPPQDGAGGAGPVTTAILAAAGIVVCGTVGLAVAKAGPFKKKK